VTAAATRAREATEKKERREREREREEEESYYRFKISTSHANRIGATSVTSGHASQGGWATNYATAGGATQSRQLDWRD
jgi:septal ring factor EnvC (AmiA/AmiB activator)